MPNLRMIGRNHGADAFRYFAVGFEEKPQPAKDQTARSRNAWMG